VPDPLDAVRVEPPIAAAVAVPETPLAATEVGQLLQRAAAATASDDAIVAVVDRQGRILGIRVEGNVDPAITGDPEKLTFAIDGAVAKARTAAFFASDAAPLTSRTIQFISQSTITQREVEADPNDADPLDNGPGSSPPSGSAATSRRTCRTRRRSICSRSNTPTATSWRRAATASTPRSCRARTFRCLTPTAPSRVFWRPARAAAASPRCPRRAAVQTRATGTPRLVGGIGVFFPGTTGFADEENSSLGSNFDPTRPTGLWAEYIRRSHGRRIGDSGDRRHRNHTPSIQPGFFPTAGDTHPPPIGPFGLPDTNPRIDLVGITLDTVGPGGIDGLSRLIAYGRTLGTGDPNSGASRVLPLGNVFRDGPGRARRLAGRAARRASTCGAADVRRIIQQGIDEANQVRAAIRLPLDSRTAWCSPSPTRPGAVLGLVPHAGRHVLLHRRGRGQGAKCSLLRGFDEIARHRRPAGHAAGTAFTNRTFRYLGEPRFPEGVDGEQPGPFSQLNDGGADPLTGLQVGPRLPASRTRAWSATTPSTRYELPRRVRRPEQPQRHRVLPGSAPGTGTRPAAGWPILVAGFGVSGDGVDQDDVVTAFGAQGYGVPASVLRADQTFVRGVRCRTRSSTATRKIDRACRATGRRADNRRTIGAEGGGAVRNCAIWAAVGLVAVGIGVGRARYAGLFGPHPRARRRLGPGRVVGPAGFRPRRRAATSAAAACAAARPRPGDRRHLGLGLRRPRLAAGPDLPGLVSRQLSAAEAGQLPHEGKPAARPAGHPPGAGAARGRLRGEVGTAEPEGARPTRLKGGSERLSPVNGARRDALEPA